MDLIIACPTDLLFMLQAENQMLEEKAMVKKKIKNDWW